MTDKEIIREGLEHCIMDNCGGCPNLATEYCSVFNNAIKRAKTEAIKEFAERLCEGRVSNDPVVIAAKCLLKEMAGEQK